MAQILVVDDDPGVLSYVTEALELQGHDITTTMNGAEAIRQCEEELDLVVTDLVMPEKNGINMIQEMRRTTPQFKVIAMSGGTGLSGKIDLLEVAKLLGVCAILHKSFRPDELIGAVTQALTESRPA